MNDREMAIALLEPLRAGTPTDGLIDGLEWHNLNAAINGHPLHDWSHSQAALLRLAEALYCGREVNLWREFGLLDLSNRARVLAILAEWLGTTRPERDLPEISLERNNAGRLFVGVTEFDEDGYALRSYVLSMQNDHTADAVMERQYADMLRLMGNNVTEGEKRQNRD